MRSPRLVFDLDKIEHNARVIVQLCESRGVRVAGVTKCACGHPMVAEAMLRGGVSGLADSRLENIERMRAAGVEASFLLLRLPAPSAVERVVELSDASLNSEPEVLAGLSQAAQRRGRVHDVILMVDLGDLREGLWPDRVLTVVGEALQLPSIRLRGLGSNLACFAGAAPDHANMARLVELVDEVEREFGIELDTVSGINSSGLSLLAAGGIPDRVNHARIGEAILLGRETLERSPWPGTHQDAFRLEAEVLELQSKPSTPSGQRGQNAFGDMPEFDDRGTRLRALLNLGRQDVHVAGLEPLDPRVRIQGACSGYLAVDVQDLEGAVRVGDRIGFTPNYAALLAAMTSEYVAKCPLSGPGPAAGS